MARGLVVWTVAALLLLLVVVGAAAHTAMPRGAWVTMMYTNDLKNVAYFEGSAVPNGKPTEANSHLFKPRALACDGNFTCIAVGEEGASDIAALSFDGVDWQPIGLPVYTAYTVATDGSRWVITGTGDTKLAYSDDPYSGQWRSVAALPVDVIRCMATNGKLWVAVGASIRGGNSVAISGDGITWSKAFAIQDGFYNGQSVAWNGTMWLAGGELGKVSMAWSHDGKTWSAIGASLLSEGVSEIATNGAIWVAVGKGGIAWSKDATKKWEYASKSVSYATVAWNGQHFIAGSVKMKTLYYSIDGRKWEPMKQQLPSNAMIVRANYIRK